MSRRFYLISRDKKFSKPFSVHMSINNVNKEHGNHSGQRASELLSEQWFDKWEQMHRIQKQYSGQWKITEK